MPPTSDDTEAAFSPAEQQHVLAWLQRGASPLSACQQLGLDPNRFWTTLARVPSFADAVQQRYDSLSHNIVTAMYKAAMEGNVSAQQFWLKTRPAPAWNGSAALLNPDNDLAELTDDQLLDACRAETADLAAADAAGTPPPPG